MLTHKQQLVKLHKACFKLEKKAGKNPLATGRLKRLAKKYMSLLGKISKLNKELDPIGVYNGRYVS